MFAVALLVATVGCAYSCNHTDRRDVFRMAFRTDPPPGITVHDALHWELRHGPFVEEWQWFLSFTPTSDFSAWLRSDKSFRLHSFVAGAVVDRSRWLHSAPNWFAPGPASDYEVWQADDGVMTLFVARKTGVHFMTDFAIQ